VHTPEVALPDPRAVVLTVRANWVAKLAVPAAAQPVQGSMG